MKCDRCENEATVHEVRIEAGKRREKHLCEQCARSEGVAPQIPAPITQLLSNFMMHQGEAATTPTPAGGAGAGAGSGATCSSCATTYAQFRQTGLLGCPSCYAQFESQLSPLLARAHEGGTHHAGKTPRHSAPVSSGLAVRPQANTALVPVPAKPKVDPVLAARALTERIATLKKRLAEAVAAEQYEKAAKLRDELARMEAPPAPGASQPAPPPAKRKPRASGDRGGGPSSESGGNPSEGSGGPPT